MTGLDSWLKLATRNLSRDAAATVRREIGEHYDAAREMATSGGASPEEADRAAMQSLGDARAVNHEYRGVMLTCGEMRVLREGIWGMRAACARPWIKGVPGAMLIAATIMLATGPADAARILFAGGVALGLLFAAPYLPIFTPSRSRIFRWVKWLAWAAMFAVAFWPDLLEYSWLMAASAWPMVWIEWTRAKIRRKLPVSEWPRQLYI